MPRGSLYDVLREEPGPSLQERYCIARNTAAGVAYLHSRQIIHRDLKSLNILLDEHNRAKLTDFGLATVKKETSTQTKQSVGTLLWMAPELFKRGTRCTPASDIYGLGMVLWELASGQIPWNDAPNPQIVPTWVMQGECEEIPSDTDPRFKGIIEACWDQNPTSRPTTTTVISDLTSLIDSSNNVSSGKREVRIGTTIGPRYDTSLVSAAASGPQYNSGIMSRALVPPAIDLRALPGVTVFDENDWKHYFDLSRFGLSFDNAPFLDLERTASQLRSLQEKLSIEGDAGVTLLTLPRGLTFNKLDELGKSPRSGEGMKFRYIWDGFTDAHGNDALSSTKRIVITNNVLNNTRKKSLDDQKALVGDLGCRLPRTLEVAALCTTTFIATGKRLYNDSPNTYTRCEENVQGRQMIVGGLSAAGLCVFFDGDWDHDYDSAGAALEVL